MSGTCRSGGSRDGEGGQLHSMTHLTITHLTMTHLMRSFPAGDAYGADGNMTPQAAPIR